MAAPRFYTPEADFVVGNRTYLTDKARHHAGRVLRMVAGDTALLFDGCGNLASGPIAFEGKDAYITVNAVSRPNVETPVAITLVQALVSPEKMDWIVEKAVETGVSRIVVVPCARTQIKLAGDRLEKRLQHWRDVAISATEQCGRNTVVDVTFMKQAEAFAGIRADRRFMLAPGAQQGAHLSGAHSAAFAVGPEGGFSPEEIACAVEAGWQCALIGPRVLRTETAGIVAATLANAAAGDYQFL